MRNIDTIFLHCSATRENVYYCADDIRQWHKARNFRDIGYHYVIKLDGTIEKGRDESEIGAHAKGHNRNSIGICYIGGLDENGVPKDTRTPAQQKSLIKLINEIQSRYGPLEIKGHNEVSNKSCPCFDVKKDLFKPQGRKPLAQSRTMAGAGVAGIGTMASELAAQIKPLAMYADTMKWVFLGLTLVGIGLVAYARWDDWKKGSK